MSNRIDLAKQLLRDGEYTIAKQMLAKEGADPQALYLLSLLYRYDDEYDQEKTVIDKALEIDGGNTYMRDRLAWHNLPIFDRVVPRQPLHLPHDPKMMPSAEVLENMCFVTGADSKYFQLMVECIESIQATQLYQNVPICIFDNGLTDEQKHYFQEKLGVKEIFNSAAAIDKTNNAYYLQNMIKSRLDLIFEKYKYLFFIDADAWCYNENSIDAYINMCLNSGVGIAVDLCAPQSGKFAGFHGCNLNVLDESMWGENLFNQVPAINSGIFCAESKSPVLELWRKNIELNYRKGINVFTEQASLNVAVAEIGVRQCLSPSNNYFYPIRPSVLRNGIFHNAENGEIVGFFHAAGGPNAQIKYQYYPGTFALNEKGEKIEVSYHYRVWPWKDKPQVKTMINTYIKEDTGNA